MVEYRPVTAGDNGLAVAEQNAVNVETIVKKASEYVSIKSFRMTHVIRKIN